MVPLRTIGAACVTVGIFVGGARLAVAEQELLFQATDLTAPEPLTLEQRAKLADPFFTLVLRDQPGTFRLDDVEALLQPDVAKRQTFAVSEQIHANGGPQSVRTVRTFGDPGPGDISLESRLFLSVSFAPREARFPEFPAIEAMGWDETNGVYNYYKLDRGPGTEPLSWRFRGSSADADILSKAERTDTCLACHINGGPVMKEFVFPWNNWHSPFGSNPVAGLVSPVPALRWAVAQPEGDSRVREQLNDAFALELTTIAAIERLNRARLVEMLGPQRADGSIEVADARRVLRPLFETTEINLVSARQDSGMHPFGDNNSGQPGVPVCAPNSTFLNANLIAGTNGIGGLGIAEALAFEQSGDGGCAKNPLRLTSAEYRELLLRAGQSMAGAVPGDAKFAWFSPEPSFIDNDWVDLLIAEGVITPEFAAAVTAIDITTPVFSQKRAGLLDLIPESFQFVPLNGADPITGGRHPDRLTQEILAVLADAQARPETPEAELQALLQSDDPVALLRGRVVDLRARRMAEVDSSGVTPEARIAAFERWHNDARARRNHVVATDPFRNLVESTFLFPQ